MQKLFIAAFCSYSIFASATTPFQEWKEAKHRVQMDSEYHLCMMDFEKLSPAVRLKVPRQTYEMFISAVLVDFEARNNQAAYSQDFKKETALQMLNAARAFDSTVSKTRLDRKAQKELGQAVEKFMSSKLQPDMIYSFFNSQEEQERIEQKQFNRMFITLVPAILTLTLIEKAALGFPLADQGSNMSLVVINAVAWYLFARSSIGLRVLEWLFPIYSRSILRESCTGLLSSYADKIN